MVNRRNHKTGVEDTIWINADGGMADDSELLAFAIACGATVDTGTINLAGDAYLDY